MTTAPSILVSYDAAKLLELLPHRYPFLLIDRVDVIELGVRCIGTKNVSVNEPCFQGHFPGRPLFPGVYITEGMAQAAGAMVIGALPAGSPSMHVYFISIDEARFRRPVVPGDVVSYDMRRVAHRRNMWWFLGEATVRGQVVAEAKLGAMLQPQ